MRNVSLRITAVAAALAAAAPAAATNGMRMIGFGPVQESMGGASAAAPLDSSAIVSNPAGLSALDRRVDVAGTAFAPTVKYDAAWQMPGMPSAAVASQSSDRPTDYIPTLGTVYKTTDKLTLGVVALGTTGMGVDYGAGGLYGSGTMTSYLNMRVAPAAAYRLTDQFSVGVALNLMYAQMKYAVADAFGMVPRDTAGSFGYGATFGFSFQAPEGVTLAASYETKSQFQDFKFDIPAHTVMTPGGPAAVPGGTEKLAFDQPDVATFGLAFRPVKPLLLAADLEWIRWSTTNGANLPEFTTDPNLTGARTWNMNWSNQTVFKFGAQFDVNKQIQVRAGYNYGSDVLDPTRAFENIAFPAIAKHHYTIGGGYAFNQFVVNAAFMYSPEVKLSGANLDQGIQRYTTKMSQIAFDLGASWKF